MFGRDYLVLWGLYRSGLKPPELITGSCRAAIQKICLRCFFCKYARRVRSELSEVSCSIIIIFRRVFAPMFWSNVPTLLLFFYTFPCTFFGWNSVLVWKDRMITSVVATPQQPEADIRSSWRSCWAAVNVDQIRSLPLLLLLLLVLLSFSHFLASWAFITSEFPQRSIQSCLIITL